MDPKDEDILIQVLTLFKNIHKKYPNFEKLADEIAFAEIVPLKAFECLFFAYVKNNYLGPPFDLPIDISEMDKLAYSFLTVDAETPFQLIRYPSLLWLCKEYSYHMASVSKIMSLKYACHHLKCIYMMQNMYGETRCPTIKQDFDDILEKVTLDEINEMRDTDSFTFAILGCYISVFYHDFELANRFQKMCEDFLGIQVNFSAVLGTRTKAQQNALSQLIIQVERIKENSVIELPNTPTAMPKVCSLEDDNLLEFIKFTSDSSVNQKLSIAEQAFVLCFGEIYRRSHPNDELINEQSLSFVTAIVRSIMENEKSSNGAEDGSTEIDEPLVAWPILTEALFKRGFYERQSLSRQERAMRQLEEITAQYSATQPDISERGLEYFFWSRMPSFWQTDLCHAKLLSDLGMVKSALDIYLRCQQWNEVVDAYTVIGQRDLAEKVIRERIAAGYETPDLYCCLGDVTLDSSYYEKAWEMSKHKSARAARLLGLSAVNKEKDKKKGVEYFEKSLEINRFQVNLWFSLGCLYMDLHDFQHAERAFRYSVTLEPDNHEAWNNLASAVMFGGRKWQTLALLKEAVKHNYESWRIWENILLVATEDRSFNDVINAYHRLIELRQKHVDPQILGILVKAVSEDLPDNKGQGASKYRKELLNLLGRVTSTNPMDGEAWRLYANLVLSGEEEDLKPVDYQKAVQYIQRSYQCRLRSAETDWEFKKDVREDLLQDLRAMTNLLIPSSSEEKAKEVFGEESTGFVDSSLFSLRMNINVFMARLKASLNKCFDEKVKNEITEDKKILSDLHETVNAALGEK
nr:tetratricopeptide repeat protein 27 [Hymenolepis microstoma]